MSLTFELLTEEMTENSPTFQFQRGEANVKSPISPEGTAEHVPRFSALNTDGTGFMNLHFFHGADGSYPSSPLLLSGNRLYGTTHYGGASGDGTAFAVNADGTGFALLHSFNWESDGGDPQPGLILGGNTLYGTTTSSGGNVYRGVVFALNTDGRSYTTLYSFNMHTNGNDFPNRPSGGLILSGKTLYGTSSFGGSSGGGAVFSIVMDVGLSLLPDHDGHLVLTWPPVPSGFTLQSTTNLYSPVWRTVSPRPVMFDGGYMAISHSSGTQEFFRLSQ